MITFNTIHVTMPDLCPELITRRVKEVAETYGKRVGEVTYVFCDDPKITEVNREFLKHDYFTDIITFDYCQGNRISGDLFISLDTVRTNAELFKKTYADELNRVVIHGVLHLCGINDKGPGEREIMEAEEDKALALLERLKTEEAAEGVAANA